MKINVLKKYQKFINIFFIIFIGYVLFSSSFSIINIADNYSFLNITLNLLYLFWFSFIFLFFMGILVQLLVNLKQAKKTTILAWKLILFCNWKIIEVWPKNNKYEIKIILRSHKIITCQLENKIAYKAIYLFLIILCYVFYAIFTISFITMLVLFRLYIGYLKKINNVITSSYYTFCKCTLTNIVFWHHHLTIFSIVNFYPNLNVNQWFIKTTSIIDNIRKTELLIQFKKQTTPSNLIFN